MTTNQKDTGIEALARLLDAYGADRSRWPAASRSAAEALIAREPEARQLYAQAEALDRALDAARAEPALDDRLAEQIVAAAIAGARSGGSVAASGRKTEPSNVVPMRKPAAPAANRVARRSSWQAAALMAASLMAGLYLGASGPLAPVVERIAEMAGISLEGDPVIALIGQEASGMDEDLL